MLARPSDSYKYYMIKVSIATYMDEAYLPNLDFVCVGAPNFLKFL